MANAAPTGGHVEAAPRVGVAALDTFRLESLDWSDDVDDLPLTYSFSSRVRNNTHTHTTALWMKKPWFLSVATRSICVYPSCLLVRARRARSQPQRNIGFGVRGYL